MSLPTTSSTGFVEPLNTLSPRINNVSKASSDLIEEVHDKKQPMSQSLG